MDYFGIIQDVIDYIEENLGSPVSLYEIADRACLSPYHFHRIFSALTGVPVSEYIRKRRLSCAAGRLIQTDMRIIEIAMNYGFQSQEAFTRAFKKHFGLTPAKYRKDRKDLVMFEKKYFPKNYIRNLNGGITMEPKIVTKEEFKVIGMECKTTLKDNKIPDLWQRFMPRMGEIKNKVNPKVGYGVCRNEGNICFDSFTDETEFESLACFEVSSFDYVPAGMVTRTIPKNRYAVFTHKGELANLRETYGYIYGTWLPGSGYGLVKEGYDFELYDERFDPADQKNSETDIYIPII